MAFLYPARYIARVLSCRKFETSDKISGFYISVFTEGNHLDDK
jgi:hypothetical protein